MPKRTKLLLFILIVVLITAVLDIVGIELMFYENLWWFDIVTHFLGGVFAGLLSLLIYYYSGLFSDLNQKPSRIFLVALLGTLIIGIVWEIFEWIIGVFDTDKFLPDTPIDIVMDLVGATASAVFFRKFFSSREIS